MSTDSPIAGATRRGFLQSAGALAGTPLIPAAAPAAPPPTAHGIVWGLGMALTEESVLDPRSGRFANANLAEYHVMVNADIGDIDVAFVDEVDPHVNSLGAKGLGEVSMTGVTGAVANAIFNATGKRIRDLPITLDKLL